MRYEKDVFDSLGYLQLFQDSRRSRLHLRAGDLTAVQDSLLTCLWEWRDSHARRDDESTGYIMSNAELLRLGMLPQLPRTPEELVQMGQPLSQYVRDKAGELLKVMHESVLGTSSRGVDSSSASVSVSMETADTYGTSNSKMTNVTGQTGGNNRMAVRGPSSGMLSRLRESTLSFTPSVPPLANGGPVGIARGTPSPADNTGGDIDINEVCD